VAPRTARFAHRFHDAWRSRREYFFVIVSSLSPFDYFRNPATLGYLNALLLFPMPFSLPGAFPANPVPNVVNGSLWTLPIEATMYLALALGVARVCRKSPVAALLIAGSLLLASEFAWRRLQAPVVVWFMDLRYVLDLGAYFFFGWPCTPFEGFCAQGFLAH
jgi:peptidoglycan/LPS O-acetylase OafA/YrhL